MENVLYTDFYATGVKDKTIKEIKIKNGTRIIRNNAFEELENLEKVILPKSVEVIEDFAFRGCKKLKEINFPNKLNFIGKGAFENCPLENVNLPDTIDTIGMFAFSGVNLNVPELRLPNSIVTFNYGQFFGSIVDNLYLPKNLRYYKPETFMQVKNFHIDKNNEYFTTVGGDLYDKDCTTLIQKGSNESKILPSCKTLSEDCLFNIDVDTLILPNNIESFGYICKLTRVKNLYLPKVFYGLEDLFYGLEVKNIISENEDFLIEDDAVYDADKKMLFYYRDTDKSEFTIPASVGSVGRLAFNNCTNLKVLNIEESEKILDMGQSPFFMTNIREINSYRKTIIDLENFYDQTKIKELFIPEDSRIKLSGYYPFNKRNLTIYTKNPENILEYIDKNNKIKVVKCDSHLDYKIKDKTSFKDINKIYKEVER